MISPRYDTTHVEWLFEARFSCFCNRVFLIFFVLNECDLLLLLSPLHFEFLLKLLQLQNLLLRCCRSCYLLHVIGNSLWYRQGLLAPLTGCGCGSHWLGRLGEFMVAHERVLKASHSTGGFLPWRSSFLGTSCKSVIWRGCIWWMVETARHVAVILWFFSYIVCCYYLSLYSCYLFNVAFLNHRADSLFPHDYC